MKKLFIIIFLICSLMASAKTRYVSTTGSDAAAGTIGAPWLTCQYGFNELVAGDTLYIRGGTYAPTSTENWAGAHGVLVNNIDGTAVDRIVVLAYPGETPILDGANQDDTLGQFGIQLIGSDYWTIKGLEINAFGNTSHSGCGVRLRTCSFCILDQIKSHNNGGIGISVWLDSYDNYVHNCDSYRNYDALTEIPGDNADGFEIGTIAHSDRVNTMRGCRSWENSDDGYDFYENEATLIIDCCWAYMNGQINDTQAIRYLANGFKLGRTVTREEAYAQKIVTNCVSANNTSSGFASNASENIMHIYNDVSFHNEYSEFYWSDWSAPIYSPASVFKNNIVIGSSGYDWYSGADNQWANAIISNNSYNATRQPAGPVVTDADFVSVDSSALYTARLSDGSLPVITYLHLTPGSDLIGAGTDVGLTTDGDGETWNATPSIGAFEYTVGVLRLLLLNNKLTIISGNVVTIQ